MNLTNRPRRLRTTPALRDMVQETRLHPANLIYPLFIEEGIEIPTPITSMPGLVRWPEKMIPQAMHEAATAGVRHVLLFGVSHHKDATGSDSLKPNGLLARMISKAKQADPHITVIADNCFCEYTDHGHCGPIDTHGRVCNDTTLQNLAQQALICAQAGADMLAPSAMMDGQITAIRTALDSHGYHHLPIMAYASKMASACYGPFREAAGCQLKGDRQTYQMNPANAREALWEAVLDDTEGADILMVKPGMMYLDILAQLQTRTLKPLAAYQVSGEYAMLKLAAQAGVLNEQKIVMESLLAFRRAGATSIITYYAPQAIAWLNETQP